MSVFITSDGSVRMFAILATIIVCIVGVWSYNVYGMLTVPLFWLIACLHDTLVYHVVHSRYPEEVYGIGRTRTAVITIWLLCIAVVALYIDHILTKIP